MGVFDTLQQVDHQLFFALNNGLSTPWLDVVMWLVSALGDGIPLTLLVGAGLWWFDRPTFRRHYAWLVLAVLVAALVSQGIKHSLERPRPLAAFATMIQAGVAHISVVGPPLQHYSFPSGHTQSAAALLTYIARLYPQRWWLWVAGILCIGVSRIYVGVHFPTDVLAGACLGSLLAEGIWRLSRVDKRCPSS